MFEKFTFNSDFCAGSILMIQFPLNNSKFDDYIYNWTHTDVGQDKCWFCQQNYVTHDIKLSKAILNYSV